MSFRQPSPGASAPATPNLTDANNDRDGERRKRLATGGRNSTFLTQTSVAAAADRSPATLTGLSGGSPTVGGV